MLRLKPADNRCGEVCHEGPGGLPLAPARRFMRWVESEAVQLAEGAEGFAPCFAERLRLSDAATPYQSGFPPRESARPPLDGSRERRIHAAENHNIAENSAGKAGPFHKAGGEALSTFR